MNVEQIKSLLQLTTFCGMNDKDVEVDDRMFTKLLKDPDFGNMDFENESHWEFCVNYLMDECMTLDNWLKIFNMSDSLYRETWSNCWVYRCIKPNINKTSEDRAFGSPIETEYLNYLLDESSVAEIQKKSEINKQGNTVYEIVNDVLRYRDYYEGYESYEKFDIINYFKFLDDTGIQRSQSEFMKVWINSAHIWGVYQGTDRPETYTRRNTLYTLFWLLWDMIETGRHL